MGSTSTNPLGTFDYAYDGSTRRRLSISYPNGETKEFNYLDNLSDRRLGRITNTQGTTRISEFSYGYEVPAERITTWSQKSGTEAPIVYSFGYDTANQLISASGVQGGNVAKTFAYTYDLAGNRLVEQISSATNEASYNALNQLTTIADGPGSSGTYKWDAEHRLVAVDTGNQRTEFSYDGLGRRVGIRQLLNGSEMSNRQLLWCDGEICEERTPAGSVSKRFFGQGMKVETGTAAGGFFYTRDHLGSIREMTDSSGNVRVRYAYDPFGRRTRTAGDLESDFGFAGMLWSMEAGLNLTRFRAYDPKLGRWLSRDPLENAELKQGHNLYAYAGNDPVDQADPSGLSHDTAGGGGGGFDGGGSSASWDDVPLPPDPDPCHQGEAWAQPIPLKCKCVCSWPDPTMPGGRCVSSQGKLRDLGACKSACDALSPPYPCTTPVNAWCS